MSRLPLRRPPPVISVTRTQPRRDRAFGGAEEREAIELAPSHGRFREAVLASVGLEGSDDDEDAEATGLRRGDGTRPSERGGGETEEEEELIDGDEAEHDPIDPPTEGESACRAAAGRILNRLFWMTVAVAAFVYIFHEEDALGASDVAEDVLPKKRPYSYKGYKDGRIPDDDVAQFGGGLLGADAVGTGAAEDDDGGDARPPAPAGGAADGAPWAALAGYADLAAPRDPGRDLPVFWHVPKSGGTTLQDLLVHCVGMVGANEVGRAYVREAGPPAVVALENGNRYVDVDLASPGGIAHAAAVGFGRSPLADVVLTSWFGPVAAVFDGERRGRCFTLLRHPIQRAISLFYYLKDASWEHTYREEFKNMTLQEYAASEYAENNWMVRFLTNATTGGLSERHLELAKDVLARKCLVGILEDFTASFKRFNAYFGWNDRDFGGPVEKKKRGACVGRVISHPDNAHAHPKHEEGSAVWNTLLEQNRYDMLLYEHALHLFHDVQKDLSKG